MWGANERSGHAQDLDEEHQPAVIVLSPMNAHEFRAKIGIALSDPMDVDALRRLRSILRCPEPKRWPRPWIPNRYAHGDIEGIEAGWDDAAAAIATLLTAPDAELRRLAAVMLQYCPSRAAASVLISALECDDEELQMHLINALAETRDPAIVPSIRNLAGAEFASVRNAVYAALGRVGRREDALLLITRWPLETSPVGRYWLVRALAEIGGPEAQAAMLEWLPLSTLHPMVWTGLREGFSLLGDGARAALQTLCVSEDPLVRMRSIEAIAFFGHPSTPTFLKQTARTDDLVSVLAAAWGLKMLGVPVGDALLRHCLGHPDSGVQLAAACRLASVGDRQGFEIMLENHFVKQHRTILLWTIATLPPAVQEMIRPFGESESPTVVRAVCDLLASAGRASEGDWMTSLLGHDELAVRVTAAISLVTLRRREGIEALEALLLQAGAAAVKATATQLWQPLPGAVRQRLG